MIASLRGEVSVLTSSACVLDVNGVGYAVALTPRHARALSVGDSVTLVTTLIVREDSMQLFGFASVLEQSLFDALLTVTGVGPRSALAVLADIAPHAIYTAVVTEDDAVFRKVSGIGPKTAKLIIVSLAGKLDAVLAHGIAGIDSPEDGSETPTVDIASPSVSTTVVTALVGLGWTERAATDAVRSVVERDAGATVAQVLRESLAVLGSSARGGQS